MNEKLVRGVGLAVGVGALLAWALLPGLRWPARAYTTFLLVPLPALMLLQLRLVDRLPEDEDREAVYLSSAMTMWLLAGLAMLAARFSEFSRDDLWLRNPGLWPLLGAAAATAAGGLALMAIARLLRVRETPLIHFLLPRTANEKIAFAGLSVSAGIAEELVFRAFLIAALLEAGAGLPVAVGVSIAVFAVAHAYQGVPGVARVALLGALLTAPLLLVGSVYPAMIAHALLDLVAGLLLADWLAGDPEH